ncbi:MAG: Asp-tRNA(Asn)/Glu-tRNA(Gln) amidotransferase subunit GatA [Alphaproteobacteria bacterium]|nr:Asp-tRNA(Asn)/Glu-tRNA(Gln) amidotransferase subunit GatA [Alphaproteobacteria bacterium]
MILTDLTACEALALLEKKEITATELVSAYIAGMAKHKELNAYITETADIAIAGAKAADERRAKDAKPRALDGLPIGVKDSFCTKGTLTTCASKMLYNFIPGYESTATAKLFDAGVAMLGKTNMDEFAMCGTGLTSHFGATKNPYSKAGEFLISAGSSSGSAAAVASGMCIAATGTDTGGSTREPASFCGVVGLKPSYGRVSRYGVAAMASSLDTVGIITRDVADAALFLKHMAGRDDRDPTSAPREVPDYMKSLNQPVKGLKIGVVKEFKNDQIDPEVAAGLENSIALLKAQGAEVVEISLPHSLVAMTVYNVIFSEMYSNMSRYDGVRYGFRAEGPFASLDDMYMKTRGQGFGKNAKRRIILGSTVMNEKYLEPLFFKAQKVRRLIANDFSAAFASVDVILTPTMPIPAPPRTSPLIVNDSYGTWFDMVALVNLAGLPAISLPAAKTASGLPIGVQLIGKAFDEPTIIKAAHALEKAAKFDNRPSTLMGA